MGPHCPPGNPDRRDRSSSKDKEPCCSRACRPHAFPWCLPIPGSFTPYGARENPRDSAHSSPKSLHSPEVPVLGGPGPARPPNRPCSQGEKLRPCQITRPAAELKAPRGRVLSSNEASCQGDPRSGASGEGVKASQSTTSPEASAFLQLGSNAAPCLASPHLLTLSPAPLAPEPGARGLQTQCKPGLNSHTQPTWAEKGGPRARGTCWEVSRGPGRTEF